MFLVFVDLKKFSLLSYNIRDFLKQVHHSWNWCYLYKLKFIKLLVNPLITTTFIRLIPYTVLFSAVGLSIFPAGQSPLACVHRARHFTTHCFDLCRSGTEQNAIMFSFFLQLSLSTTLDKFFTVRLSKCDLVRGLGRTL